MFLFYFIKLYLAIYVSGNLGDTFLISFRQLSIPIPLDPRRKLPYPRYAQVRIYKWGMEYLSEVGPFFKLGISLGKK